MVRLRTFYGPPGYGEDPAHDSRETQAQLRLARPVCVNDDSGGVAERYQLVITLVPLGKGVHFSRLIGQRIQVRGKLYPAETGHHHTPLLLSVENAADVRPMR
jgi:Domain of unknown function (DUF4431)